MRTEMDTESMAVPGDGVPARGEKLASLARDIHEQNVTVGWWDQWPDKTARHETAMMLVISELAEAMEGHRKGLMDDHLPHYPAFAVELADALIRLLDLAGAYGLRLNQWSGMENSERALRLRTPPEQLYWAVKQMVGQPGRHAQVHAGIGWVLAVAKVNQIDLMPIVAEKRAYNAQRADHKRTHRARQGGKAY